MGIKTGERGRQVWVERTGKGIAIWGGKKANGNRALYVFGSPKGGLKPIFDINLFEDIIKVCPDCMRANEKFFTNLLIARPYGNERQYLNFSLCQDSFHLL